MTAHCEQTMNDYLALDKNERVPPRITRHLLVCGHCRARVRLLTRAEHTAAHMLAAPVPLSDPAIARIMQTVAPAWSEEKAQPVSMRGWIFGGILMIVFMLAFRLFRGAADNDTLLLAFYLFFALAVTAYCAIFVGTNLDFFIKKARTMQTA